MTVYVDRYWGPYDKGKWKGGGHLLTSDLDELHQFAKSIGLRREWFQGHTLFAHYDLTATKRMLAVNNGAVQIETGEFPPDCLVRRKDGSYEPYSVRMQQAAERLASKCFKRGCEATEDLTPIFGGMASSACPEHIPQGG